VHDCMRGVAIFLLVVVVLQPECVSSVADTMAALIPLDLFYGICVANTLFL
jgi:hypothetical protein